jgi:hypothetical protein
VLENVELHFGVMACLWQPDSLRLRLVCLQAVSIDSNILSPLLPCCFCLFLLSTCRKGARKELAVVHFPSPYSIPAFLPNTCIPTPSTRQMVGFRPFTCATSIRSRVHLTVARIGGGSNPADRDPSLRKLIIPGQDSGSGRLGNLIIPGDAGSGGSGTGAPDGGAPPPVQNFRPPPGFMEMARAGEEDADAPTGTPQEMLDKLSAMAGKWHQLAKLLLPLQKAGFDSNLIEDITGIERKTQNTWMSAAQVRWRPAPHHGAACAGICGCKHEHSAAGRIPFPELPCSI